MKLTLETIPPTTVEGTPEECCAVLKILGLEPMIELPCNRGPKTVPGSSPGVRTSPRRLMVRTPALQAGYGGSNPPGDTYSGLRPR